MRIVVIGASQGVGAATIKTGLAAGHRMRAFARHPERLGIKNSKLELMKGDALDPTYVKQALEDQDVAIVTLGMPTLRAMGVGRWHLLSEGTRNVIAAAEQAGLKKVVIETAIGSGESRKQLTWFAWLALRAGLWWLFQEKDEQERITRASGIPWTIVRPTALTNGPYTGEYLAGSHLRAGGFTHVSRADAAEFLIKTATDSTTNEQTVTISYPKRSLTDVFGWARYYK